MRSIGRIFDEILHIQSLANELCLTNRLGRSLIILKERSMVSDKVVTPF